MTCSKYPSETDTYTLKMPSATSPVTPELPSQDLVSPIRDASRQLVRELGFLHRTLAGTNMSAAAVHMLLEIGDHGVHDAVELHARLKLDGGSGTELEAALKELKFQGHITARNSSPGITSYHLTARGSDTLRAINAFGVDRVQQALDAAAPEAGDTIAEGLRLYANALAASSTTATQAHALASKPVVRIETGYRPGFLARCLQMHMDFYYPMVAWGRAFETSLARDFGQIMDRLDTNPNDQIWAAVREPMVPGGKEEIVGTILMDGHCVGLVDADGLGQSGVAHIRGFIVDEDARGLGVGKKLMDALMQFVKERGFEKVVLYTMGALTAAVHLYRSHGFTVEEDKEMIVFERPIKSMKLIWQRPAASHGESS